ncbi:MAG: GNAT family N-acetyltransferase [Clostridia bacterium]|nr:GNAT family N-acetyltransferase [Clostridia bacterium]
MIVAVDKTNVYAAAEVHSASWRESHRSFCAPDFIARHTPEHQREYIGKKMRSGSRFYMLVDGGPVGIVSVTGDLIEDLYVLPEKQGMGYGTELLRFAVEKCRGIPTLWILENNERAARFYRRKGFVETGRIKAVADGINEIEFKLE